MAKKKTKSRKKTRSSTRINKTTGTTLSPDQHKEVEELAEVQEMLNSESVDLLQAMAATDKDVEYFNKPKIQYPEDGENFDWRKTGFWGGYHKQADEVVENQKKEMVRVNEFRKKIKKKEQKSEISKHLGKQTEYPQTYDPSVLVAEPRQNNRTYLDIHDNDLPFVGYDLWNAYEVSCLSSNGVPITGVARILYPANSEFIVESKSLKLYLNSFNMSTYGDTPEATQTILRETIKEDLSKLLKTNVEVEIILADGAFKPYVDMHASNQPDEIFSTRSKQPNHIKFKTLERSVSLDEIVVTKYVETPELLQEANSVPGTQSELYLHSSLLKSNCKVTHQPDWGDVFIYIAGMKAPCLKSLLEYIISFRGENHFHEEICEAIYTRLNSKYNPIMLGVACLYVRRGGIDINPIRVSDASLIGRNFNPKFLRNKERHLKLIRQ